MNPNRTVLVAGETALIALSVLTTIALERLFIDTSFLREVLVMVIGSHLVAIVCRRADLSMAWSTAVSFVAVVLLGTAVFYPETAAVILPTRETLSFLSADLREAWDVFSNQPAPVPAVRGFLVTTAVLIWYGAFLADWAAFRLRSPLEAIAPASAIFVFAALMGVDRHQVTHGVLFAAAVMGVLLTMRAQRQAREEVWVGSGLNSGVQTTLRVGAAAGVVAVLVGGLVAPRLPGASAEPLFDVTELDSGRDTRRVISPLVQISASLVEQSDQEIFSVRVDREDRDYWRLMALTSFDGDIWRRSSNFSEARGPVGSDVDSSIPHRIVRQEITTSSLGNIYLPAAYEVSNVIDSGGVTLEYEVATGALVVDSDDQRQAELGITYIIESAVPDYNPADLPADATEGLDRGFVEDNTQLPPACAPNQSAAIHNCWPTLVNELAESITASASTDYERAVLLQDHFTDPRNYTYDLNVALEHDVSDVEAFLLVTRRGYCEQFASTFAAMARSLGIPARVAVGFTWGEWSESRGEYVVRGHHAHAWPEVYFAGAGWIVFDPTPGRSRPVDADITGQATPLQYPANEQDELTPTTTIVGDEFVPGSPNTIPAPQPTGPEVADSGTRTTGGDESSGFPRSIAIALMATAVLGALLSIVPLINVIRRRRRMNRIAADPIGRGELAWDDAIKALRLIGVTSSDHLTPLEVATLVERTQRELGPIRQLAESVTHLRYSEPGESIESALEAHEASAEVVKLCRSYAEFGPILAELLHPRALLAPS